MLGSARGFYSLSLTQLQLSFLSLRAGLARVAVGARGLGRAWRRVWRLALGLGLHLSCHALCLQISLTVAESNM